MIESFKHKGLRQLFENDNPRGINAEHLRKIKQILAVLDAAEAIEALQLPTFRLHPLKGSQGILGNHRARELESYISI